LGFSKEIIANKIIEDSQDDIKTSPSK